MKIFDIFKKKTEKNNSNDEFREILNNALDYLGLNEVQKRGFLFQLGCSLPISSVTNMVPSNNDSSDGGFDSVPEILSLYSVSTNNFEDYGDLNDVVFSSNLYNFNYIVCEEMLKMEGSIDDALRKIEKYNITFGKSSLDDDWISEYKDLEFNISNINNLFYDYIERIGNHLNDKKYSLEKCYEAGSAFYFMQTNFDIKGTHFLVKNVNDYMPPMFMALRDYPVLFKQQYKSLIANHIFSSTFQMFSAGIEQEVLIPIHRFHQLLFYEKGTAKFRKEWDFENGPSGKLIKQTFLNAIAIRKTDLMNLQEHYLNSNQIFDRNLKQQSLTVDELFRAIQHIMFEKYGLHLSLGSDINEGWHSSGEFMEFSAMLFYETCMHSLVLKNLNE